jgi:hypothetical protein
MIDPNNPLETVIGRRVTRNPAQPVAPFSGDQNSPNAGGDIERMCTLATKNAGAALAALGQEMRSRITTSINVNERAKK